MRTLHLTVSETAYEKLKVIFSLFGEKDLKIQDDAYLEAGRRQVQAVVDRIDRGEVEFYTLEEVDAILEETIRKYEA
jgi:hypothetical protein